MYFTANSEDVFLKNDAKGRIYTKWIYDCTALFGFSSIIGAYALKLTITIIIFFNFANQLTYSTISCASNEQLKSDTMQGTKKSAHTTDAKQTATPFVLFSTSSNSRSQKKRKKKKKKSRARAGARTLDR